MYDLYLAHILIYLMVGFSCARVFFIREARIDSFAVLPLLSFLVSIVTFAIWGLNTWTILGMILAFVCLMTNLRSIYRLVARLYVDHYNPLFVAFSVVQLLVAVAALAGVFYFRPVKFDDKVIEDLRLTEQHIEYKRTNYVIFESSKNKGEPKKVILFIPTATSSIEDYQSYFSFMVSKGWTVISSEFYAGKLRSSSEKGFFENNFCNIKLIRNSLAILMWVVDRDGFEKLCSRFCPVVAENYVKMYYDAADILGIGSEFYVVTDGLKEDAAVMLNEKLEDKVKGFFALESVEEYKTSGFGFIEQTDVLIATRFNVKRDKTYAVPKLAAEKTIKAFEKQYSSEIEDSDQ